MQTIARQIRRRNATFVYNSVLQKPELITFTRKQKNSNWIKKNAETEYNDGYLILIENQTVSNRKIIEANKMAKLEKQAIKFKN